MLVGERLSRTHLAADLRVFGFGPLHEEVVEHGHRKGEVVLIHRFALHVQCPWRIERDGRIVTGRTDLYEHVSGQYIEDWDHDQGGSLQAAKCEEILALELTVKVVSVDPVSGDVIVAFDQGHALRLWPAGSVGESWRFFGVDNLDSHVVFGDEGPEDGETVV